MRIIPLVVGYSALGWAVPTGAPIAEQTFVANVQQRAPSPTPASALDERGLGDDIKSYVGSLASGVESKVSSLVESGILNFPNGFPTGTAVEKSLGVSSTELDVEPTQVLNLP